MSSSVKVWSLVARTIWASPGGGLPAEMGREAARISQFRTNPAQVNASRRHFPVPSCVLRPGCQVQRDLRVVQRYCDKAAWRRIEPWRKAPGSTRWSLSFGCVLVGGRSVVRHGKTVGTILKRVHCVKPFVGEYAIVWVSILHLYSIPMSYSRCVRYSRYTRSRLCVAKTGDGCGGLPRGDSGGRCCVLSGAC